MLYLLAVAARGQDVPPIRNFTPADYAGQNQNWALLQTERSGWIFAGNNGGLLEFDGAQWRQHPMPEKQTVRAVGSGRNGEVFCGGFAEFGFWKPDDAGRLTYTSLSDQVQVEQLAKEEIWHILVLDDYVLFQSFSTIYKYNYKNIAVLRPPSSIMFLQAVNGNVWLPAIGHGLYELLPDNTFRFVENTGILGDKIVQFLVPDGKGGVWAGTTDHGIFSIRNGQCKTWENSLNTEFKKYQLNKAVPLSDGGWAIGTILNGVYVLDPAGLQRFHLHRENGLQNNTVLALMQDRNGDLWIGLDRGIDFVALHAPLTLFSDQTGRIGTVYTAAEWRGKLYIGTNQGVFMREDCRNGVACESVFRLVDGSQGQVWQLRVFDEQLLCGHNGGTFVIENGVARKISEITGGWCTVRIPGRKDELLQSTYTGLIVFSKTASGNWQFSHRIEGFDEPLKKIAFDMRGALWGAHPNKGLHRLKISSDMMQITEYKGYTREDGIPSDFRLDLSTLNDGKLVINAAPVPLIIDASREKPRFVPMDEIFARGKVLPGFRNELFIDDSSGVRWMRDKEVRFLPLKLVPSFENIVVLGGERYFFCLENGFAILDRRLADNRSADIVPAPAIRCVETGGGEVLPPEPGHIFSWQQNSLRFRFAIACFERAPKFSWRLDGFSERWSPWQHSPEKEFTNLPPGRYTFRLRTDLGNEEVVFPFRIKPPFYLSEWAFAIYLLLGLGLFWGIEKINRRRLDSQRQKLEAEKQNELSRQRTEAEREKLMLEVENKNRELSNAALNLIRKNEVLQRLKDDLLDAKNEPIALQKIVRLIDEHLEGDHDWEIFEESFNRVHDDFFKRLMHDYPELTPGDMRLAAYLKMNLSSKEIAPLLNISVRGVENKRYRLRKKLGLSEEANLTEFIMNF
ncbi:MAG: hypothetical protein H6565_12350 [Lewinellaceae bacterium]|nr:hypothetical protein [Lewinellaceae bacterium]